MKHLKKIYTYLDRFPKQKNITFDYCENHLIDIVKAYQKEVIFRTMSKFAIDIGMGNDFKSISILQLKIFNIPIEKEIVLIHRQAVCVIFQYLFSLKDEDFGTKSMITTRDAALLFMLANQMIELDENKSLQPPNSSIKRLFFTNIKEIHFTDTKDDIQAGFYLFKKYYQRITDSNNNDYDRVIKEIFGFSIGEYVNILERIENRDYPEIFSLFDKFAVIEFDKTYTSWQNRNLKLPPVRDFLILQKYPLIKINTEYLVNDIQSIFTALFRNIYRVLIEFDNLLFKGFFGKHIVEPAIIELLQEIFVDENVRAIKVTTKKREYGDFGLLYKDCIFLFEIKSSLLNDSAIYTDNFPIFMKIFKDKFVVQEGIHQQVKKIQLIENNYEHFCNLTKISPSNEYTIYPILLSFDEKLMSFCCNSYLSTMFEVLKRVCRLKISKIKLAPCHSTVTFNEIYRLRYVVKKPSERLELLKKYSDQLDKDPVSFSFYLQELNAFTISTEFSEGNLD